MKPWLEALLKSLPILSAEQVREICTPPVEPPPEDTPEKKDARERKAKQRARLREQDPEGYRRREAAERRQRRHTRGR